MFKRILKGFSFILFIAMSLVIASEMSFGAIAKGIIESSVDRVVYVIKGFESIEKEFFKRASSRKIIHTFVEAWCERSKYITYKLTVLKNDKDEIIDIQARKDTWIEDEAAYEYYVEGVRKSDGIFIYYKRAEKLFPRLKVKVIEPSGQIYETIKRERLKPKMIWEETIGEFKKVWNKE
jgi:hypothetical protein